MKHLLLTTIPAVLLAGCASRPAANIDQLAAMYWTARVEQDVVYRSVGGMDLRLDVFAPDRWLGEPPWWQDDGRGKKPTLLYIHGGGFVEGDKESIIFNILPFIARNWVVISIDYRLARHALAPAAVEDCLAALDWVHEHADEYRIDTERIVVSGESAGGHLSLLTGMLQEGDQLCGEKLRVGERKGVAAIVNWYGITDFALFEAHRRKLTGKPHEWFDPGDDLEELLRSLSPVSYVRRGGVPVISIQGSDDPAVLANQAEILHEELQEAGVKERLVMIPGKKHGDFSPEESTFIYSEIWSFLESAGIRTTVD